MAMNGGWVIVKPGVIALSGTPFQIRRQSIYDGKGNVLYDNVFCLFDDDKMIDFYATLSFAKTEAQTKADELREIGLIAID